MNCVGLAAGCVVIVLAAVGCSDDPAPPRSSAPRETVASTETTTGETGASEVPSTSAAASGETTESTLVDINRLPPVGVGEAADFGGSLYVTVTSVDRVELEARGPGSTAGPGIDVAVVVDNQTGRTVDLIGIAVGATYGDGTPAPPAPVASGPPLAGQLAAGARATGHYAFRVPGDQVESVVLDLYDSGSPNVVVVTVA